MRGDLRTAREIGEQCLTLAQGQHDPVALVEAHRSLGHTLYYLGEFVSAREQFEQGIILYNAKQHDTHHAAQDPGVSCLAYAALTLWILGYPDQALCRSQEALTLAQQLSHPFSQAYALSLAASLHQFRRERQEVQDMAEVSVRLSAEQGFSFWWAWSTIKQGWALAEQQSAASLLQMRQPHL